MIRSMVSQKLMPLDNLDYRLMDWTIKTIDAFFIHDVKPKIGSIAYCNLAIVAEHTGIYVGDGKIVHLNGSGLVEMVSAEDFCERLHGTNPSFTIFCPVDHLGKPIGDKRAAEYAISNLGRHYDYNLAFRNCHCFSASCLERKTRVCPSFSSLENLITEKYGSFHWRATELTHKK